MFRPTLEYLEQREVCSADPAFAAFHDAGSQGSMGVCNHEVIEGRFLMSTPTTGAAQLLHSMEFNLAFRTNGQGSDHAWGSHH